MYCKKCGGKIESYASHCPFCGEALATNSVQSTYTASGEVGETSHKSIGGWILTYIILAIPLLNFIMLLVWAFGSETKKDPTFRNWARTSFVLLLITVVLFVSMIVVAEYLDLLSLLEYMD